MTINLHRNRKTIVFESIDKHINENILTQINYYTTNTKHKSCNKQLYMLENSIP